MIVRRLLGPPHAGWRPLMQLYARTFDTRQRETEADLVTNLTTPERPTAGGHIVLSAEEPRDRVVGGAIFSYLPAVDSGYASYVFVDESRRGAGVGSRLLREIVQTLRAEAGSHGRPAPRGLFAEVQRADPADAAADTRFRFWRRNGLRPLAIDWHYPPLQDGVPAVASYLAFGSYAPEPVAWYPAGLEQVTAAIFDATYDYLPGARATRARIVAGLRSRPADQPVPYLAWPERHESSPPLPA